MLNYLASEMFRARRSVRFVIIMILGMLVPIYISIGFFKFYQTPEYVMGTYLGRVSEILLLAGFTIGIILINFLYKGGDYLRLQLSTGIHRRLIVVQNLFTIQVLTILISLIFLITALVVNLVLSRILGYDCTIGLESILDSYRNTVISQMLLNQQLIGLIFLTNSRVVTTILVIIISYYYPLITSYGVKGIFALFRVLFPYYYLLESTLRPHFTLEFLLFYFINAAVYFIMAYQSLKRRDY